MNFLRYFGCSNICFLEFLISLANFRLTWRIVAPTRRKIARKLGDISKRIECDILSHYFCKLPHTNTSTTSFFGWTRSTSCAFLRLAVTLVTSCGFLRGLEEGVLIPHSHSFTLLPRSCSPSPSPFTPATQATRNSARTPLFCSNSVRYPKNFGPSGLVYFRKYGREPRHNP